MQLFNFGAALFLLRVLGEEQYQYLGCGLD
jgi:hypothetical protein